MTMTRSVMRGAAIVACALGMQSLSLAAEEESVGNKVLDPKEIKEKMFPELACKELEDAGLKCMGFKPRVNLSLPTIRFALGKADLPKETREQLNPFAKVFQDLKGMASKVFIEGHADASGNAAGNLSLSQRRAEAVKTYLVQQGADPSMLQAVGRGTSAPKVTDNPFAAENRRVVIGRPD